MSKRNNEILPLGVSSVNNIGYAKNNKGTFNDLFSFHAFTVIASLSIQLLPNPRSKPDGAIFREMIVTVIQELTVK